MPDWVCFGGGLGLGIGVIWVYVVFEGGTSSSVGR